MSLGHLIKTLNTTPVASKVSVHVSTMSLSANASDRKFMVWLQRKGKSRGTALVRATGASVNWAETVTQTCTLYRCPDGTCKRKRFDVVVIWNSCQEEAPGQVFGKVEIDVSESCGKVRRGVTERPAKCTARTMPKRAAQNEGFRTGAQLPRQAESSARGEAICLRRPQSNRPPNALRVQTHTPSGAPSANTSVCVARPLVHTD